MMKAKSTTTHQSKFMKFITIPIRALAKARDFYVKSMNNYADNACYGGASGFADPLPRSFSSASVRSRDHDDDFRELLRVASTTKLGNRIDLNSALNSSTTNNININNNNIRSNSGGGYKGVPRSASVGMAKIEEDKPIEFNDEFNSGNGIINGNDLKNNKNNNNYNNKFGIFPRSRSYAVGSTKRTPVVF